ncbi:MtaA/CmuA family methyltransferase [Methanomassiliicoccus luminyensis]|uniref:MtaA/CmuA family methyltransferase n=1 Tax=Methanomassiliicoccus luminyensis TaxID=1080712 RepID=UPI000674C558|nr:MtaA/CmuA family methyltransferase [Methanomassiliicoccus luminyensis]
MARIDLTPTRRALAAVLGGRVDYTPPANPLAQTTNELMNIVKASWPKAHYDAKLMADLAAAPHEVCGVEAARPQFDISLEAEVLGCKLDWNKPDRPPVTGPAYTDPKDVTWPTDLENADRIPHVLGAIDILRKRYDGNLPIIPVLTAPFTVAGHIAGVENLVLWTVTDPEKAHKFISAATDFCIEYGRLQTAYGAHILFPADPSASGDLISGETYREFVLPYHKKLASSISAPKVLHICGNTKPLLPYIREAGFDAFSFDVKTPVWYARKILGNKVSLLGSLDVIDLMPNGTPEQVYARTVECIQQGVDIVGSGCDVSYGTSLDNIKAYVRAAKETPIPDPQDNVEDAIRAIGAAKAKRIKAETLGGA